VFVERGRTVYVCGVRVVWPVKDSLKSALLYWYVCRSRKRYYSIYPSSSYAVCLTYNLLGWVELHRLPTLPLSQTRCLQQSHAFTH